MTTSNRPSAVPLGTYFVALVAQREAQRLASAHPGKLFQAFQAIVEPAYVEPKPKTFTGREVRESAPAGIYLCSSCGGFRAKVLIASGTRAVLFASGRHSPSFEAALGDVWDEDEFIKIE